MRIDILTACEPVGLGCTVAVGFPKRGSKDTSIWAHAAPWQVGGVTAS